MSVQDTMTSPQVSAYCMMREVSATSSSNGEMARRKASLETTLTVSRSSTRSQREPTTCLGRLPLLASMALRTRRAWNLLAWSFSTHSILSVRCLWKSHNLTLMTFWPAQQKKLSPRSLIAKRRALMPSRPSSLTIRWKTPACLRKRSWSRSWQWTRICPFSSTNGSHRASQATWTSLKSLLTSSTDLWTKTSVMNKRLQERQIMSFRRCSFCFLIHIRSWAATLKWTASNWQMIKCLSR